jgi:hypothetical protein
MRVNPQCLAWELTLLLVAVEENWRSYMYMYLNSNRNSAWAIRPIRATLVNVGGIIGGVQQMSSQLAQTLYA